MIQELLITDQKVFEDKKTQAKTIAFNFDFPDGKHGYLMVTRLSKLPWNPTQDLKLITLTFHDH
jgi:hypothetical protein